MENHAITLDNETDNKLVEQLQNYIQENSLVSLERVYGKATSDFYDKNFQESRKKLSEKECTQFIENANGSANMKFDHVRLFEIEDGSKILISQPCDVSGSMLIEYLKFAQLNDFTLRISNNYSAWDPVNTLTVMFMSK